MQKKLLTSGNVFKRTDGRWGGVIWYMDERDNRKRKSFSETTKQAANKKITAYISEFETLINESDENKKLLKDSLQSWLEIFKFPSVEPTTYDRCECTAINQIYPILGDKVVGDITAADIKSMLNSLMNKGLAFSTVKKAYALLNEYFRIMHVEGMIRKNPMDSAEMIKKANFLSAQGKEMFSECDKITILTKEEREKFKKEAFAAYSNGQRKHRQAAAYILMLNTGARPGEILAVTNRDIDMEKRQMKIRNSVKEVYNREGTKAMGGRMSKVGKTKTLSSNRTVPLNETAIEMIKLLREEYYFGEDSPLICDEKGNYTKPVNFRKRFYRILDAAGIERKGLHSLRHTFATNLVNGVRQPDGTIKALSPKQVADILGHTTSEITERYYVRKDTSRLNGITDGFEI